MTRTERAEKLMAAMTSFGKEKYQKDELLSEMFSLQREIVELTFNEDHATTARLRIWDVENHFEEMNRSCGNAADEELQSFKSKSREFCNMIRAEISGAKGEAKAFRALLGVQSRNIVLKNIELKDGELRTELDAIVITPESLTIVEVKNTSKDIFIDEKGNYYRTGEFLKWDCNIADRIMIKEALLRNALEHAGIRNARIQNIVVFTDDRIEVQNKCSCINTCFASQLACIIDGFSGDDTMSAEKMVSAENAIRAAESKEAYPVDFDVKEYKKSFASLMAILEEVSMEKESANNKEEVIDDNIESAGNTVKRFPKTKFFKYASGVAAAASLVLTAATVFALRKGGMFR